MPSYPIAPCEEQALAHQRKPSEKTGVQAKRTITPRYA